MSIIDGNPYSSPSDGPNPTSQVNNETTVNVAKWLLILVVIQLTVFSIVDFLAQVFPDWGQVRLNGIIASWGVFGLLSRTRLGGVLPVILVLGALLSQLSTSGELTLLLVKACIASCVSAVSAVRRTSKYVDNEAGRSWNEYVCEGVGWCCGVAVFGSQLLTIGSFMNIPEASFSYAGIGLIGAGRQRLFVCFAWLVTWHVCRFGVSEAIIEVGVAFTSLTAGRAAGHLLGRRS